MRDDPRDVGGRHDGLRVATVSRYLVSTMAASAPGVHHRLRERRLVDLVVAEIAEAAQVDDDASELVAPRDGGLEDAADRLGVVGDDVEDGRAERLAEVGRVHRASALLRRRREADLVVADDVDRPARPVRLERDHLHRLVDDALPGERGVAVDDHGQHAAAAPPKAHASRLPTTSGLTASRCDGFGSSSICTCGRRGTTGRTPAQVVLDVADADHAAPPGLVAGGLELAEDDLDGLPHDVAQHVEALACARVKPPAPPRAPSMAGARGAACR